MIYETILPIKMSLDFILEAEENEGNNETLEFIIQIQVDNYIVVLTCKIGF